MKNRWRYIWSFMLLLLIGLGVYSTISDGDSASRNEPVTLADAGWDSIQVHNFIAAHIIEHGYDHPVDIISGSSIATFAGLRTGEIDVYMEVWYVNLIEPYTEAIEAGEIVELSTNLVSDDQGFHVPTYVIEGDTEKGIEPMAPDLKTVADLKKYPELFKDPQDPSKGVIIGTQSGSVVHDILEQKVETYGLDDTFNYFTPGSPAALNASLARAYMNNEPWVGYQWSPTWTKAKYDLTLLEEPPYDEEIYNKNYGTKFPDNPALIAAHAAFAEREPVITEFLSNYQTSTEITGEILLYMEENEATPEEAALWFLRNYEDVWTEWIPEDVAARVLQSL